MEQEDSNKEGNSPEFPPTGFTQDISHPPDGGILSGPLLKTKLSTGQDGLESSEQPDQIKNLAQFTYDKREQSNSGYKTSYLDKGRAMAIAQNLKRSSRRDVYNVNKNDKLRGSPVRGEAGINQNDSQSFSNQARDSIFNIQTSVIGMNKHSEKEDNHPNLDELINAQKTAISSQRKQTILEQLQSNQVGDKKQTYNPYHLSSYNKMKTVQENGQFQFERQSRRRDAVEGKKQSADYALEIRKQMRRKKEIETNAKKSQKQQQQRVSSLNKPSRFKRGDKLGFIQGINPITEVNSPVHMTRRVNRSKRNQMGLGVMGQRARMIKTLNFGMVAKEQMHQIEEMQDKILENLQILKHAKEAEIGLEESQVPIHLRSMNASNTIYKMDPNFKEGNEYQQQLLSEFAYQQGKKHLSFLYKIQHGHSSSNVIKKGMDTLRDSTNSIRHSRMSCQKRRIDALRALENYVINEELQKNKISGVSVSKSPNEGLKSNKGSSKLVTKPAHNYSQENIPSNDDYGLLPNKGKITENIDNGGPSMDGEYTDLNNQTITNEAFMNTKGKKKELPTSPDEDRNRTQVQEKSIDIPLRDPSPIMHRNQDKATIQRENSGFQQPQSTLKKKRSTNGMDPTQGRQQENKSPDPLDPDGHITQIKIQNQIPKINDVAEEPSSRENKGEVILKQRRVIQVAPKRIRQEQMGKRQKSFTGYYHRKGVHQHIKSPGRLASNREKYEQYGEQDFGIMQGIKLESKQKMIEHNNFLLQQLMDKGAYYSLDQDGQLIRYTGSDLVQEYGQKHLLNDNKKNTEDLTKSSDIASAIHVPQARLHQQKPKNQDLYSPESKKISTVNEIGLKEENLDLQQTVSSGETKRDPNRTVDGLMMSDENPIKLETATPMQDQEIGNTISNNNSSITQQWLGLQQSFNQSQLKQSSTTNDNLDLDLIQKSIDQAQLLDGFKGILPMATLEKVNQLSNQINQPRNKIIELLLRNQAMLLQNPDPGTDKSLGAWPGSNKQSQGDLIVQGAGILSSQRYDKLQKGGDFQNLMFSKQPSLKDYYRAMQMDQKKQNPNKDIHLSLDQTLPPGLYVYDTQPQQRRRTAPGWANRGRRLQIDENEPYGIRSHNKGSIINRSYEDDTRGSKIQANQKPLSHEFPQQYDGSANVALDVLKDVDTAQRRRKELRNLMPIKERNKFNFIPRPPLKYLIFKNKSEEQRFGKLAIKILQIDYMNQNQINQLYSQIKRFLAEYLNIFRGGGSPRNPPLSPQSRLSPSRAIDQVEDRYVYKMIEGVRKLSEREEDVLSSKKNREANQNYELYVDTQGKLMYQDNFTSQPVASDLGATFSPNNGFEPKSNLHTGDFVSQDDNTHRNEQDSKAPSVADKRPSISIEQQEEALEAKTVTLELPDSFFQREPTLFKNFIRHIFGLQEVTIPEVDLKQKREPIEKNQLAKSNSQSVFFTSQREDDLEVVYNDFMKQDISDSKDIVLEDNVRWIGQKIEQEMTYDPAIQWAHDYLTKIKMSKYKVIPQNVKEWKEEIRYHLNRSGLSNKFSDSQPTGKEVSQMQHRSKESDPAIKLIEQTKSQDFQNSKNPYSQADSRLDNTLNKQKTADTYGLTSSVSRTHQVYSQQYNRRANLGKQATQLERYENQKPVFQPQTRFGIKSSQGLKPNMRITHNTHFRHAESNPYQSGQSPKPSTSVPAKQRQPKITLEHIMHRRVMDKEDDEVCAELHKELRNLEKKGETKHIQIQWRAK